MFVRCANWLLTHSIYRIKVYGAENIPATGGALIVCNHASYVDPPLILATLGRPVRFLMWRPLYEKPFIHFFSALTGAIPIAEEDKPKDLLKSIIQAREAIKNGDLVCIFPEGGITRIGHLIGFNRGLEKIVKGLDVPIIPAYLDRVWGSIFSYENGKFFWKWPKELPYRLSMHYGKHLPAETPAFKVRIAVQELSAKAVECRSFYQRVLHFAFIKEVKRRPFRTCVVDSSGQRKSFIRVLAEALALSKVFKLDFAEDSNVGILLPPSSAGMLCNLGLLFAGKVPVNLNYTLSKEILNQSIAVAGIKNVISVKEFSDRFEFSDSVKVCDIKNLAKEARKVKYLATLVGAMLLPIKSFKLWFKIKGDPKDLATIIFSSGSTGKPKGVMLTHQNISANIEGLFDLFQFKKDDALMGVLPFFHSFGFTVTLWMPLLSGFKAIYHNNPIDSKTVGKLVEEEKATILLSTPTFLSAYTKRCTPEQFRSLKRVIVGAEKLKAEIRQAFEEKFKLIPLEGYGATELSPVASINIDNYEGAQGYQVGNKPGSVGHPLPGIAAKVVHPETFAELDENEEGLLLIKGANLMQGYLDDEKRTAEVIRDGWYVTGDIAKIDREGFIVITDRMARFSKIGGEMVPHIKIEEELERLFGNDEQNFVVTAIPDQKKGEQLIVFYNFDGLPADFVKKLSDSGLPNLWIPKQENFIKIETFPLLGSGKLDLRNLKERAEGRVPN
jgi:acyl-[acyl-carrier-protein]-phospholipid O-acyltransferase / long-chain-fatty-acid--[acyl-carrier-protein] ligase